MANINSYIKKLNSDTGNEARGTIIDAFTAISKDGHDAETFRGHPVGDYLMRDDMIKRMKVLEELIKKDPEPSLKPTGNTLMTKGIMLLFGDLNEYLK